jgi:hypothetical protein
VIRLLGRAGGYRETERERQRETDRERQTERDRQTERERERERERENSISIEIVWNGFVIGILFVFDFAGIASPRS